MLSGSKLCFLQAVCSSIHETATYLLSEDATPQIMLSSIAKDIVYRQNLLAAVCNSLRARTRPLRDHIWRKDS